MWPARSRICSIILGTDFTFTGQGNEKVRFHQLNQILNRAANFIHTTQEHDPQHGHVSWLIHPGPQVSRLDSRCQGRRRGVLQRVNELLQLIGTDIRVPRRVALHRVNRLFQHGFNHTFHPLGRCCHNRSGVTGRSRIGRLIDRDDIEYRSHILCPRCPSVLIWCCQGSCTPINLRLLSLYNPPLYLIRALLTQLGRIEMSLNKVMYYVMYHTHIVIPVKTTFKLLVDNF